MDVLLLSRIQFGFTIAFHYIFPPLNIGLSVLMVIMEGLYLKTKNPVFHVMAKFWTKIFGLAFAVGVATGIVMEFEFGTNWAEYSRYVGDVFGSALASEGIFAFFLESGFLGLLLFGWDKVKPITHFIATVMVSLGAHFSAIWIVAANSWMQTPAGFRIEHSGLTVRAEITDYWSMIFNPSSMDRLIHVLAGCWQAGAAFVLSVSSYYILKNKHEDFARKCFKIALCLALFSSAIQIISGDSSAKLVARYQPAKLAAMEGHFENNAPADLYLFGLVDEEIGETIGIKIPGMSSFLLHDDFNSPVPGVKSFAGNERPPVSIVFQSFHLMVLIGFSLLFLNIIGMILWIRNKLFSFRWVLWLFVFSVLAPQIANLSGWITAEVGRQPWIVYGLLKTSEGLSKNITSGLVISSLVTFTFIYVLLFILFIYLLNKKIQAGPEEIDQLPKQRA